MYKTHPEIRKVLEGGECLSYGARALNEGGYHAIPKLTFPGGMLAGDSAGFLNVAKIKGSHNAIKTGMLAAEAFTNMSLEAKKLAQDELVEYEKNVRDSWVVREMKESRNFKGGFDKGLWFGLLHGRIISTTKGKEHGHSVILREIAILLSQNRDSNRLSIQRRMVNSHLIFSLISCEVAPIMNMNQPSHLKVNLFIH